MKTKTALMLLIAATMASAISRGQDPLQSARPAIDSKLAQAATNTTVPKSELAEAPAKAASTNKPASGDSQESTNSAPDELLKISLQPDVTLPNAVQMLARMAKINFQFDPQLLIEKVDEKGNPMPTPVIGTEIRWEGVTAAQALQALLDNYNWQMTPDPKTGITRISRKDPRMLEPMVTKVIALKYVSPTNLYTQITNIVNQKLTGAMLVPDPRTSQMVIMAPERHMTVLEAMIEKLDTPTKQILIEARLIETTRNPRSIKGVDWSKTLEAQNLTFGNGTTTGTINDSSTTASGNAVTGNGKNLPGPTVTSMNQTRDITTAIGGSGLTADTAKGFSPSTAFLNADGVHAVLSFINSDTESEQVALPRTVAQDGVQTELSVVQNIPLFEQNQSPGAAGTQPLTTVRPNYEEKVGDTIINEVGVKLKVRPRIVGDTNVLLDLHPEISDQDPVLARFTLNGTDNTSPVFNRRQINTLATVPSGYTLVLGGLNHDFSTKSYTKVPLLGDIPGIGMAFRHENKSRTKQNLMIFVTPTIIEDTDFQSTKTEFLKNHFVEKPDVPESAWDSAKPKDWTKPKKEVEPAYQSTAP